MWGLKPLALYLVVPGLLMCVGMLFFGGRSAEAVMGSSGNFYHTLGILVTIYLLYRGSKKRGTSLWEECTLEWRELNVRRMALLGAVGLGFAVFVSAVITIIPFPQGLMDSYHSSSDGLMNGTDRLLVMTATVLMAPVAEEIVFRGYMLGRFLQWFTPKQAMWVSAVIFALCHVSALWMIYACFMGLMLAWVSIREDNTAYSIALHVGFNLSVVPINLINGSEKWRKIVFGSSFRVALLGGLAFILAMLAFSRYRREEII